MRRARTSSPQRSTRSGCCWRSRATFRRRTRPCSEGRWERSRWGGVELADKVLGVLGFGRIGRQVARRALALEMKVVAYDPFVSAERLPRARRRAGDVRRGARARGVPDAAPAADRRHAERDRRRHDRAHARRRPDRERRARRAASTRRRSSPRSSRGRWPVPRSTSSRPSRTAGPLLHAPNVVVTPHLAASTEEAQDRAGVVVAEQVVAALDGGRRDERGEHPFGRRRGSRGARPVRAARGEARPARDGASRAARHGGSGSRSTASSPSTTRDSSPSPR